MPRTVRGYPVAFHITPPYLPALLQAAPGQGGGVWVGGVPSLAEDALAQIRVRSRILALAVAVLAIALAVAVLTVWGVETHYLALTGGEGLARDLDETHKPAIRVLLVQRPQRRAHLGLCLIPTYVIAERRTRAHTRIGGWPILMPSDRLTALEPLDISTTVRLLKLGIRRARIRIRVLTLATAVLGCGAIWQAGTRVFVHRIYNPTYVLPPQQALLYRPTTALTTMPQDTAICVSRAPCTRENALARIRPR